MWADGTDCNCLASTEPVVSLRTVRWSRQQKIDTNVEFYSEQECVEY